MVIFSFLSSGCAIGLGKSLHQYSLNEHVETKSKKARKVESETEQNVIIATSNTDFADTAYKNLLSKCPNGSIVNITAQHSTDLGFLAYREKMKLTGTCVE